ncbi:hypothetical protein BEP19_14740 [Ammoniphilus oxalaticus]|uniref:AB hydrolase-1 domain-containing protein n=1 Tax=Ammoniphilus oxalaticus TaxID=66863 RepID=A0A419SEW7_9BACL|nr:alpha/beta hydrolase [Ammoniphilus oxalaticus]RKD21858.1 hypothetical protein BEP19_14740 [Ammoniphilus oxalaticus]
MASFIYDGFEIHYTIEGEGKTIVFLHGLGGGSLNWVYQRNQFKQDYQLIAVDLPGHGKSEGGDEIPFYNYQDLLKTLLIDELRVDEIILCGLSMGGKVAIDFASRYPDTVAGLFIASTFADMNSAEKRKRKEIWDMIHQPGGADRWLETVISQMGLDPQGPIAKGFSKALESASLDFMYNTFTEFLDYEQTDQLDIIDVPAIIIHGDRDDFVPQSCANELFERLVNSELEILTDCGHLPNVEKPQEFNALLDHFAKVCSNPLLSR